MEQLRTLIENVLTHAGGSADVVAGVTFGILIAISALLSSIVGYVAHRIVTPVILHIVDKTETKIDDYFFNLPVLKAGWQVLSALLFYIALPYCYTSQTSTATMHFWGGVANIYVTITMVRLITAFLNNARTFTSESDRFRNHNLIGIIQFLKILVYFLSVIIIVAFLLGQNPVGLVAGLGAAATVLMFIFKDTVLGLVAGIQLSINHMIKPGDWVTLDKHGINGIVQHVTLTTVKIRNFDNTISTIPPYTLVSESFQNWEGMRERNARRVKRSLFVDAESLAVLQNEEVKKLAEEGFVTRSQDAEEKVVTNLTLFRHYAEGTLRERERVLHEESWQWVMARQLEPTPNGIPIELWFYLNETEFVKYEDIAATYVEQLIAVLPKFGLCLYQHPSSRSLKEALGGCSTIGTAANA